jgi:hypothetical protein
MQTTVLFLSLVCFVAAQHNQQHLVLAMSTTYAGDLSCEFNSNAMPAGGKCYNVTGGHLIGPCSGAPKTMKLCSTITGCQWSPNMLACKAFPLEDGKRRIEIDNSQFYKPNVPNILNLIVAVKDHSNDVCEVALENTGGNMAPLVIYHAMAGPLNKCAMTGKVICAKICGMIILSFFRL